MSEEVMENIQLAENEDVEYEDSNQDTEFSKKRNLLKQTKITKQTWSILEIYRKIDKGILILDPKYQRRDVWGADKQTAFIESLFMGIVVPPIYVVENLGNDILDTIKYEVVDGKQRLTSIFSFIREDLKLLPKNLEYYSDWFGNKKFGEIKNEYDTEIKAFLSQVLDVYVITANSPEFTKYDIFSRLNKGAVQLRVNEIRRAIYRSELLDIIDEYVSGYNKNQYKKVFSKKIIERYEDYGKFYRAIAAYVNTDLEKNVMKNYNSRPREMINDVLEKFQKKDVSVNFDKDLIIKILDKTMYLLIQFKEKNSIYFLDACIRCAVDFENLFNDDLVNKIKKDEIIQETFEKSASTTKNVNKRIERVHEIVLKESTLNE